MKQLIVLMAWIVMAVAAVMMFITGHPVLGCIAVVMAVMYWVAPMIAGGYDPGEYAWRESRDVQNMGEVRPTKAVHVALTAVGVGLALYGLSELRKPENVEAIHARFDSITILFD